MAVYRSAPFEVPEAQRLADIAGVIADLRETEEICDRWIEEWRKAHTGKWDMQMLNIYCSAALVRYGRTFGTGVRDGVPRHVIDSLPEGLGAAHRFFKDARDKWVAHSANSFELNHVQVALQPKERGGPAITSVSVAREFVASLSMADANSLKTLASEVRERMKQIEADENARLLTYARSLPLAPFYESEGRTFRTGLDPSKVRKRYGED